MQQYEIDRLGQLGDGITKDRIHVPLALPGEVVTGNLQDDQLRDVRIVTPSADRVAPPCPHFKSCGGCVMQHGSDTLVAEWKSGIVRKSLENRNLETNMRPITTSPSRSRLRAGFAARRTKKGAMSGFHARGSDVIIEVPECVLIHPDLHKGREVASALARLGASRKGALSVMVTRSETGLDVLVSGGKPLDGALRSDLAPLAEHFALARLAWDDEVIAMRAPPAQRFGSARVVPPPGAFMQATEHGANALVSAVQTIVGQSNKVADLFAGSGTFALPLAAHAEILAVEGDGAMMAALDRGWRETPGLKAVKAQTRDLFRRPLMPDELKGFDAIVIDPPRAGAEAQIEAIVGSNIDVIAYVSCNPVTFSRDAAVLVAAGYSLDWVLPVDQFRWSAHVELVAQFTR